MNLGLLVPHTVEGGLRIMGQPRRQSKGAEGAPRSQNKTDLSHKN